MTEIKLRSTEPNYADWLAYGKQRFGVIDAPYATKETEAQRLSKYENALQRMYAIIERHTYGIQRGVLTTHTRNIDAVTRDRMLDDLLSSNRIHTIAFKRARGPRTVLYCVRPKPKQ